MYSLKSQMFQFKSSNENISRKAEIFFFLLDYWNPLLIDVANSSSTLFFELDFLSSSEIVWKINSLKAKNFNWFLCLFHWLRIFEKLRNYFVLRYAGTWNATNIFTSQFHENVILELEWRRSTWQHSCVLSHHTRKIASRNNWNVFFLINGHFE